MSKAMKIHTFSNGIYDSLYHYHISVILMVDIGAQLNTSTAIFIMNI
uniref:Uncharacterized protein n=1 Tax=Moniliophthora roreri TaxID=221103 RepID=A0A0W0GF20_MONRR